MRNAFLAGTPLAIVSGLMGYFVVQLIAVTGVVIIVVLLIVARPLLFASVDPEVGTARGLPMRAINTVFFILLALSIAEAVPAVGALLNSALLITPAAIAILATVLNGDR